MELTATEFVVLLLATVLSFLPSELDDGRHPRDASNCTLCDNIIFDFIIVGAGSAGAVVANRLTENPDWTVLLIEAGGDENFLTDVPLFYKYLSQTRFNWKYTTVRQSKACLSKNGFCDYPRGKGMGGSSTTNVMMYVRGNRADFDGWEAMGNPGWGYASVLPYFLKSENVSIPELTRSPFHSNRGPHSVSYARYHTPALDDLLKAGVDFGLKVRDYNGLNQNGIGVTQLAVDGAMRCSTGKAFLDPIRNRRNLFVYKHSHVTRIIVNESPREALGVEFVHGGRRRSVFARKEVVLSAGSINTPQILMLSGIGPRQHLQEKGIPVIADLPVGMHMEDHTIVGIKFLVNRHINIVNSDFLNSNAIVQYVKNGTGVLTTNGVDALAFFNFVKNNSLPPEIQFHIETFTPNQRNLPIIGIGVTVLQPESQGWVRLNTTNPFDKPLINPNYYSRKRDFQRTMAGVKESINFMKAPSMRKYDPKLITTNVPQCTPLLRESFDAYLECYIMFRSRTIYHPVGTARMGPASDPKTVVNSELEVHGIRRLRVIDASVMPKITRGNTDAPSIMIGEKGADFIKRKYTSDLLGLELLCS